MTFRIGQKVVCINDTWAGRAPTNKDGWIVRGEVYTVTSVHTDHMGISVVWLAEVARSVGAVEKWGPKVGFSVTRFRPATDITVFIDMLENVPLEEFA